MHVIYTGPFEAVEIAELGRVARYGEDVEVPDELGARLCEQACWQPAKSGRPSVKSEEQH